VAETRLRAREEGPGSLTSAKTVVCHASRLLLQDNVHLPPATTPLQSELEGFDTTANSTVRHFYSEQIRIHIQALEINTSRAGIGEHIPGANNGPADAAGWTPGRRQVRTVQARASGCVAAM